MLCCYVRGTPFVGYVLMSSRTVVGRAWVGCCCRWKSPRRGLLLLKCRLEAQAVQDDSPGGLVRSSWSNPPLIVPRGWKGRGVGVVVLRFCIVHCYCREEVLHPHQSHMKLLTGGPSSAWANLHLLLFSSLKSVLGRSSSLPGSTSLKLL